MPSLRDRLMLAKDLAAAQESDLRVRALLAAIDFEAPRFHANSDIVVTVPCRGRQWFHPIQTSDEARLRSMDIQQLAMHVAHWLQQAITVNVLSLDDPPREGQEINYLALSHAGSTVTYIYDSSYMLTGIRWEPLLPV